MSLSRSTFVVGRDAGVQRRPVQALAADDQSPRCGASRARGAERRTSVCRCEAARDAPATDAADDADDPIVETVSAAFPAATVPVETTSTRTCRSCRAYAQTLASANSTATSGELGRSQARGRRHDRRDLREAALRERAAAVASPAPSGRPAASPSRPSWRRRRAAHQSCGRARARRSTTKNMCRNSSGSMTPQPATGTGCRCRRCRPSGRRAPAPSSGARGRASRVRARRAGTFRIGRAACPRRSRSSRHWSRALRRGPTRP